MNRTEDFETEGFSNHFINAMLSRQQISLGIFAFKSRSNNRASPQSWASTGEQAYACSGRCTIFEGAGLRNASNPCGIARDWGR